jgi:hypothetical protein
MRKLAISLLAVVALSGCDQQWPQKAAAAPTAGTGAASEIGRFVIVHSPQVERDTILLDTKTGQTWGLAQFTDMDGDPYGWQPIYRADTGDGLAAMRTYYGAKPPKPSP